LKKIPVRVKQALLKKSIENHAYDNEAEQLLQRIQVLDRNLIQIINNLSANHRVGKTGWRSRERGRFDASV